MLRSFLGANKKAHGSTHSLNALDEPQALEDAMYAVTHIMNDDLDAAEEGLSNGNSAFHKLGKGLTVFLRAALGFEQDVMKEASEALAEAENSAYDRQKHAQRHSHVHQGSIYPPGAEYGLCLAESELMSAVVAVLNESLTESIRGFYKLRKAYLTLDAIMVAEKKYLANTRADGAIKAVENPLTSDVTGQLRDEKSMPLVLKDTAGLPVPGYDDDDDDDADDFYDADEAHEKTDVPVKYLGHLSFNDETRNEALRKETGSGIDEPPDFLKSRTRSASLSFTLRKGPDMDVFAGNPVNSFIHSGTNLCFGLLQVIISIVPPAFSPLLKIIGFKGDREAGIQMLWQATKFGNINGAFAGLILLGYYNGIIGFCDIIPRSGAGSIPRERCRALLTDMRAMFPNSRLWLLEEARMLSGERHPDKAVEKMENASKSQLKQVDALQWFERSLNYMYMHNYQACSDGFQHCVTLNNWSHALYFYIAGAAHIELYRKLKSSSPGGAAKHKKKAEELLKSVPKHTGKRRFMARQLPFDVFALRKIQKWESRAHDWKVDFVDAVGISPIEEMIYFWNGYKRMRPRDLETSLANLEWSRSAANPLWPKETLDEHAICSLLTAATLRNLGRTAEAKTTLESEILSHEWLEFKGAQKDVWTCPVAHYEMAANFWAEYENSGDKAKLLECSAWLQKVAGWESYELEARMGLRVKTGQNTVAKAM